MIRYLLDTDTLSELLRARPSERLLGRLARVEAGALVTTVISVFELKTGCLRRGRTDDLWHRVRTELLSRFQVLALGEAHAERAAELLARQLEEGLPIGIEDTLIAAIALDEGCCVITGNERHLSRIAGLDVENWIR